MGADVLALVCDVSEREQVDLLIERVSAHFGQIDILVNNAGIITVGPQATMTVQDFTDSMNTMFWGTVYPTLAVLPAMRACKNGHIVNITSIGGKVSVPHLLPYSSAKFAAVGFSQGLHAELAGEGVRVTTVVPGLMRTGSHVNAFVKGNRQMEYTLFGLLATLPFTSTSATSAARQIVRAICRGETELIITPQAQLLARFHGLLPGLTTNLLSLIDRALPRGGENDTRRRTGRESRSPMGAWLTRLGEPAAYAYNQYIQRDEDASQ
jgi:short-subunit dehydrogenase